MSKTALACIQCGYRTLQWVGRCPSCGAWESFVDGSVDQVAPPVSLADISCNDHSRITSGIGELDRVLGGGLVAGSVVLLAGEPGIGKSTLMLQAAAAMQKMGRSVLLICGEESLEQVAARAARIGGVSASAHCSTDTNVICGLMRSFEVVIVDSVQTLREPAASGEPGSVTQVRASAMTLSRAARESGAAVVLIGHVTKDGAVAGPRVLEHLVDAVITFEGDGGHSLRVVRSVKNRFGPSGEVGIFEMGTSGLKEIPDASGVSLGPRRDVSGYAVGCAIEGRRPLAIEIQSLAIESRAQLTRRVTHGIDPSRLGVILAILQRRAGVALATFDVYATVAGGLRVNDPGLDLAIALAAAASRRDRTITKGVAAVAEIGLGGELRPVPGMEARLRELTRLGFDRVIVPSETQEKHSVIHRAATLREAIEVAL